MRAATLPSTWPRSEPRNNEPGSAARRHRRKQRPGKPDTGPGDVLRPGVNPWVRDRCGRSKAHNLPIEAGFFQDCGTQRPASCKAFDTLALRHSETCRSAIALGLPTRAGRCVQVLGGHSRTLDQSPGQAPGRRSGGSSTRLRRLRRHDSERSIWRRHGAVVGPRLLASRERRA